VVKTYKPSHLSRLKRALEFAQSNTLSDTRMAACVLRGKTWFVGYNNSRKITHAESSLISKCKDLEGATVYVVRVTKNNQPALARPCNTCHRLLFQAGVAKVIYSIGVNEYGILIPYLRRNNPHNSERYAS